MKLGFIKTVIGLCLLTLLPFSTSAQMKREMRGAWIQCVNGPVPGAG